MLRYQISVWDKFVTGCEGNVEDDELIWRASNKGVLDIPSAYRMIANLDGRQIIPIFNLVWRWKGYEMGEILLWKIARGALPTNLARCSRKMTLKFLCPLSKKEPEPMMHCLRDCEEVRRIWRVVVPKLTNVFFFAGTIEQWITENISFSSKQCSQ